MGYISKAAKGVTWMWSFRGITRVIAFVKILVLARLLTPLDFGAFGIATLVLGAIDTFTEVSTDIFLIQEKDGAKKYYNEVWTVSILRGTLLMVIIIFMAPFASSFFRSPQSLFLIILISLVPFFQGFDNPSTIVFQKDLFFNKEFFYRLTIYSADAISSITLTLLTRNVMSLAVGTIIGAITEAALSFFISSPTPKLSFDRKKITYMFHRCKWITLTGIFIFLSGETDSGVVGKVLGQTFLGIYQMAFNLATLPISEITDVVSKVFLPVFSKIEEERKRLLNAYLKSTLFIGVCSIIIGTFLFFFTKEIVLILLGEKWIGAVPIIKILVIFGVVRATFGFASTLFLSVKKQSYHMIMTFVRLLTLIITIVPLTLKFGLAGTAFAAVISSLVEIPIICYYTFHIFASKK